MKVKEMVDTIPNRFSAHIPIYLLGKNEEIKLEIKPYLQPFEQILAIKELKAFIGEENSIDESFGYYVVKTDRHTNDFIRSLTYWQRVGRDLLEPTLQIELELTQNGIEKLKNRQDLHSSRRLRYGPHDLHEYRGKFFPQLVKSLINISQIPENGIVLDPMCGSGTTPCEAVAYNKNAIGADLNPLSVLIASVKSDFPLEKPDIFLSTIRKNLNSFDFSKKLIKRVWNDDDIDYLNRWFDPSALLEVENIYLEISQVYIPLYQNFFKICLSNIIRSVSWQKETDLRVRKEITEYAPGTAIKLFIQEVENQIEKIFPYLCVLSKHPNKSKAIIREGNAVNISSIFPEYLGKVDVLITSPPYATALPYLDTDRLSLVVLNLLSRKQHKDIEALMVGTREISEARRRKEWERYKERKNELPPNVKSLIDEIAESNHADDIGFRRRNLPALLGRYFLDMLDAMRSARLLMKPGAKGYYVVGNNSTSVNGQKLEISTDNFLFEIGEAAGWIPDEMLNMELLHSRDIFKENRGSKEAILCFKA